MSARADSKDATATAPVTEQNNGRDNGRHKEVRLSENARTVLTKRYLRRGLDGKPAETIEEMFWRVASHVAEPDREYTGNVEETSEAFYDLLTDLLFMPNSPTFTGAGTPLGQLAACFVLPIVDDMGRHPDGIFSTLRNAALIQQTGGGNGFSFSRLRPKNDAVLSSVGVASGPVGFLRVYDAAFGEIAQGGCLLPETLVFTDNGLLRLDEIADTQISGWQPHTLQVATDEGLRPSPRAFNNGVAPVLRVHTREGLSLAGTPEHRVKVMTEQGLQWRALQDLRSGDWISVHLRQHRGRFQALRQPRREHGNQAWPNLPHVLDEELAFFLGYLIGDGFVASQPEDHRVGVSVAHTSYLITEMPALLERLFGVTIHRQQKPNDRSITFVMDNRAVKEFLLLNGLDKPRSREACTPRLIRQSPPGIIGAFLRGLFEADGTFSQGYPSLMTVSPRLAEEVATLLIGLGCPVRVRSIAPGVDHWGHGRMYQVRIQSSAGLQAWRDRIGCDLRSRFVAGYSWESDLSRESTYVLPASRYWLQPVLDAITLEQVDARGRSLGRKFRSRSPRLRRTLLRYLRGDRQFTRSAYDQLCRTYPNFALHARSPQDWWFVQVRDVQPLGESLTLDLEVDGNHTYLAYGMVTHNTRRGANMAVLRVDHPDIEEFIECKSEEGTIVNFNISVGITDAFMRAVEADADFALVNPRAQQSVRTVKARELFDKIARYAHRNGEPGLLFLDTANRGNPVPHLYELEATNPCGEQWLGAYENCCLGSINLAQHVTPDGEVDWKKLQESTEVSTHFLDNVVTANAYVPAVPQLKEAAHRARRIGLGIMGLADMMYHLGIRYGSEEGQEFAAQVMEFVRYHCMRTSIKLAKQRGPFLAMEGSIYDPNDLKWSPPQPLKPYTRDWGRPNLNWDKVVDGIKRHGIRNAAQTTVAPTGTIATVSGCEGYGCEPVFALAYFRNFKDGDKNVQLTYASPLFDKALQEAGLDEAARQRIVDEVGRVGSCQGVMELPDWVRHTYVVSQDITAEEHVFMQAAIQAFVDNSISKCVTGDTLILTDQGLVPVAELSDMRLPDQFQAHELMVFTPNGVEHSDTFYYGGMRETRRVHLSYGYEIEGTPNHPIQTLGTDGRIRFTPLDELRVGETVVLYSGQEAFGPEHQPLPSYSGPWRTNSKDVRFPERMTTELAYLLGCITSEGSISRNGVTITHSSAQLLTRLGDICHNLFGLASHLIRDTRRESVYTLQINSRALRNWLLADLGLEAVARHKIIPTCILRGSRREVAAFLRGLFLDAYMTQDGRMFGIGLASRSLIRQLQTLLLNFGVFSRLHRSAEHAWALTVAGKGLDRLAQFVEFDEMWKSDRLMGRDDDRQHITMNYGDRLPGAITGAIRELQPSSSRSLRSLYGRQTEAYQRARVNLLAGHRLDRESAHILYQHFNDVHQDMAETFFSTDRDGMLYVQVEGIESGFAEVFDISVPTSHAFIANGLGNHNTCNFPEGAKVEDVKTAYMQAWKLGCKGLTVYVTGSREHVVLETRKTAEAKQGDKVDAPGLQAETPLAESLHSIVKPRPRVLHGVTYRQPTPLGTAFITVNANGDSQPFEVFLTVGKAGSDIASVAEAFGRLISLVLRLPSTLTPRARLEEVCDQLAGIGGGRPMGFGPNRVRSLPDGIAQALAEHLGAIPDAPKAVSAEQLALPFNTPKADLCPECGQATFVNEEGCRKCHSCGFSEC